MTTTATLNDMPVTKPIPKAVSMEKPRILTPKPSPCPRINGARVFGVRPDAPFLFKVAATGQPPLRYEAEQLPDGLFLDRSTGLITGKLASRGSYRVQLRVHGPMGEARRELRIECGDEICLTPPMGWNSWYVYSESVSDAKVRGIARAMKDKGLVDHGWTYVNLDDTWQGVRGGPLKAIQGNDRFPDMKGLCDKIHALGLKMGIYSTPWMGSYTGFIGGTAPNVEGDYTSCALPEEQRVQFHQFFGRHPGSIKNGLNKVTPHWFIDADVRQWEEWGVDYVKFDWAPNDVSTTQRILHSLRAVQRDIVFSMSNSAPFERAADWSRLCNLWRTTRDINDEWEIVAQLGFSQDPWRPHARPGHWNDPDMLQMGLRGETNQFNEVFRPSRLTPDEQYAQMSLWCLLSAPLLLSCDIASLDEFTLSLLTNDEVLEVNQDPRGRQAAQRVVRNDTQVWAKEMEDGSMAVGLFNLGDEPTTVVANWKDLSIHGKHVVRDLWRQEDLGRFEGQFSASVPRHGVVLVRICPVAQPSAKGIPVGRGSSRPHDFRQTEITGLPSTGGERAVAESVA